MRINELYLSPSCSQISCTCMRMHVYVYITMSVHQRKQVCVCVYTFELYVLMCHFFTYKWANFHNFPGHFSWQLFFVICFYCCYFQVYLLVVSLCFLFVYLPKLRFFMFLRTNFASTLSKPQVNTQCARAKFFEELSITI